MTNALSLDKCNSIVMHTHTKHDILEVFVMSAELPQAKISEHISVISSLVCIKEPLQQVRQLSGLAYIPTCQSPSLAHL